MQGSNGKGRFAVLAPGFGPLSAVLMMGLSLMASSAEAAPFAYVTGDSVVSVIDTASNMVVATVPVGSGPSGVAVTPDGTKVYVANSAGGTVSALDTASNKVVATVPVGSGSPQGVAVTPDGKYAYVVVRGGGPGGYD